MGIVLGAAWLSVRATGRHARIAARGFIVDLRVHADSSGRGRIGPVSAIDLHADAAPGLCA
jgi:hypothetical protein